MTRSMLEFQRVRGEAETDLAKIRETIGETELQIVQVKQEFSDKAVTEHKEVRDQVEEVRERARVAKDVLARTTVTAPVRGMVQSIRIHTTNGVVRPAEPLLDIVPLDDDLLVNAQIRPIDIDNVAADSDVEVRFSAFSAKTTPGDLRPRFRAWQGRHPAGCRHQSRALLPGSGARRRQERAPGNQGPHRRRHAGRCHHFHRRANLCPVTSPSRWLTPSIRA